DEVQAEHILIRTDADMDDMAKAAARLKAEEAKTKIKAGMTFPEAVAAYSEDETTQGNGGSLGWFSRGQMVPAFEKAAFGLKEGGVSDLVETQFGIHLIHVSGRRSAKDRPWDEMQRQVMLYQQAKKQTDGAQAAVDSLRTAATVVSP
ncbi:MAG TPA: peptidylprolyl isomerase, partial [Candidatus Methylomirabilis sp.]